jgi:cytochrome c
MKPNLLMAVSLLLFNNISMGNEYALERKLCSNCHAHNGPSAAPSWAEIARHYRGNKDAHNYLPYKIIYGGFGIWGKAAMPPQRLTIDEARQITEIILHMDAPPAFAISGIARTR